MTHHRFACPKIVHMPDRTQVTDLVPKSMNSFIEGVTRETGKHRSTIPSVHVVPKPEDDILLKTDSIPETLERLAGKSETTMEETVESETSSTESDSVRIASLDESFPDPQDTEYTLTESVIFRRDCIDNSYSLKPRQGIEIC